MKEGHIVNACMRWLCVHGCYVWRQNTGVAYREYVTKAGVKKRYPIRFGQRGSGDIVGMTPTGRHIEVECKTETGEQRMWQRYHEDRLKEKGALYILARSADDLEARKEEILA